MKRSSYIDSQPRTFPALSMPRDRSPAPQPEKRRVPPRRAASSGEK